jgi:hypothetical protein
MDEFALEQRFKWFDRLTIPSGVEGEHLDIAEFKKYFNGIVTYQNPTLLR